MEDDMNYGFLWVIIAYFFSIVFFFTGWVNKNSEWVWYGLYFFIVGILFNINNKLNFLVNVFNITDINYELFDEKE